MKRCIILTAFLIMLFLTNVSAMELSAKSAILIDGENNRVIYSKNSRERMGMASTTKIMTALVALEKLDREAVITVSRNASATEGSSIYLKEGEQLKVKDALYALVLASANDVANAISENVKGGSCTFVEYMNNKACFLGLKDTHFDNPSGLSSHNHYTTAYDLALITAEAMKNPGFSRLVSEKTACIKSLSGENDRYVKNHNKLLWMMEGCTGVKTGFTKKDGRCLVSSAEREGVKLIAVTLNAPDDWKDHMALMDYGFERLERKRIVQKGERAGVIKVHNGTAPEIKCVYNETFDINLYENEKCRIKHYFPDNISAPVKKGQCVGYCEISLETGVVKRVDIASCENVDITNRTKLVQQFINLILQLIKQ